MRILFIARALAAVAASAVVMLSFPLMSLGADTTSPAVLTAAPAAGATLSNWSQIVVTFSEPVANVNAFDLLVNGTPAVGLTNSGNSYFFTASQPSPGGVAVRFDSNGGISDQAGNLLDTSAPANRWSYTLLDLTPPAVLSITPMPGATVSRLEAVEVLFNEAVIGVDAGDLLINGVPATTVSGSGAGPYHFDFLAPALGVVQLSWAAGHGITDLATVPNACAGGAWSNTLVSSAALGRVIIN